jgi:hypothetical protein
MVGGRVVLACIAAWAAAGCATLPEYKEDPLTTADVIRHIRCELRHAVWSHPGNEWIQRWKAGYTFSMEVNHLGGLDSESTWVFPLNQGATFVLALTGGFTGSGTRTEKVEFDEGLTFLRDDPKLECFDGTPDRHARLGGQLGFSDLLERVGHSRMVANIAPTTLAYDLVFVIKKAAGVAPRFNLIPIGKEKTYTGSLKWAGSHSDTQTLRMVFTPPAKPDRPPQCEVALVDGRCPLPVYMVEKPTTRSGSPGARAVARPSPSPAATRGVSADDQFALDRARGRSVLESIEGELRRQRVTP